MMPVPLWGRAGSRERRPSYTPGEVPLFQHKRETEAGVRNELTECGCLRKEGEWPTGQGPGRPNSPREQAPLTLATWFLGVTGGRQNREETVRAIFGAAQAQVTVPASVTGALLTRS